ncbi:ATP-binding protein [Kitasatospora herbaricolor]|uniref:ATP-binding protein n=1 Tax=Kitasatospora herbaricolor TaxID=68217 RepID=UPI0036DD5950
MDITLAVEPHRSCWTGDRRLSAACVMPATALSVPALRHFALDTARRWNLPDDIGEALRLIVTELVTNAVRHSGGPDVTLLLCAAEGTLTVQVKDSGTWLPPTVPPDGDSGAACGGRGLLLVEVYAASYEVRASARGTTVAAELAVPLPAEGAQAEPQLQA